MEKTIRSERLLSLTQLLADGKTRSAPQLARRFGTSVRTLYRDIEMLGARGVPIETITGRDGGYRVLPGFTLDRSILTEGELAAVAAVLEGLGDATGNVHAASAMVKLRSLLGKVSPARRAWIRIELSPGTRGRQLIEILRSSIEEGTLVSFEYVDAEARATTRIVEPAAVAYLWQSWYLYGYCRLRQGWRLFKLNRVRKARRLRERFQPRPEPSETAWRDSWDSSPPVPILLRFRREARARAEEWFGPDCQTEPETGDVIARIDFPINEWLFGFLLSFGPDLRVTEPTEVAREIAARASRIAGRYENSEKH
jgi:predicted DNA-binding transcriptional regulator YafY